MYTYIYIYIYIYMYRRAEDGGVERRGEREERDGPGNGIRVSTRLRRLSMNIMMHPLNMKR